MDRESEVLAAYGRCCADDPEGAFAPYYHTIAAAAGGDVEVAYSICKALRRAGLLECGGRQARGAINAPAYWITDAGLARLGHA